MQTDKKGLTQNLKLNVCDNEILFRASLFTMSNYDNFQLAINIDQRQREHVTYRRMLPRPSRPCLPVNQRSFSRAFCACACWSDFVTISFYLVHNCSWRIILATIDSGKSVQRSEEDVTFVNLTSYAAKW